MRPENWLPIPGYEGRYCVSDHGNVMSMDYARTGLPGIMKHAILRGYHIVELQNGPKKKRHTVHSLVALAFIGPRPDGLQINHIDGCKANNKPENLEYISGSENQKHAFRTGLASLKGERHTQAKLTNEAIVDIRKRAASGETQKSIADNYGVSQSAISYIVRGKRWPHIASGEKPEVIQ